jgi:AraC family transcriptional regulator
VCDRCIMAVTGLLRKHRIAFTRVGLGEVHLREELSKEKKDKLQQDLPALGFELIDNRKTAVIERIKKAILAYIAGLPEIRNTRLSAFIAAQLRYDYSYLSDLYSSVEGSTIENFYIRQRIEKVKELLVYDQLSLSEIAYDLGFSSVHHLSAQFKKVTGLTPTHFKKVGAARRETIDKI